MSFDIVPEFIYSGSTPYRVITITSAGFMCIDMINGSIVHISPSGYQDDFIDNKVWAGYRIEDTDSFEVHDRYNGIFYTYHFRSDRSLIHREDGPALLKRYAFDFDNLPVERSFWLNGELYRNAEHWFEYLTPEQKKKAAFNLDEIKE